MGNCDGSGGIVSDDIMAFEAVGTAIKALPRFPQLKMPLEHQPSVHVPEQIPIHAIYILDSTFRRGSSVSIDKLNRFEAVVSLVRNTVAAKLYRSRVDEGTHGFMQCISQPGIVSRISFPLEPSSLASIHKFLLEDLKILTTLQVFSRIPAMIPNYI